MAARTASGKTGSKPMPPAASTPVETVTMQPRARTMPAGPSRVMPPALLMRWTGAPRRTGKPSPSRATRVPKPSAICGFSPSSPVSM